MSRNRAALQNGPLPQATDADSAEPSERKRRRLRYPSGKGAYSLIKLGRFKPEIEHDVERVRVRNARLVCGQLHQQAIRPVRWSIEGERIKREIDVAVNSATAVRLYDNKNTSQL